MSKRSKRSRLAWPCLWVGATALGCEDPLTDPAVIAGPRIVGARVGTEADPTVAEPTAGQAANIDWLLVSNDIGELSANVVWCSAAPSVLGAPRCAGSPFAEQTVTGSWGQPLRLAFELPADSPPGSAWLAWIGICDPSAGSSKAQFDPATSSFRCADGDAISGFYRGFVPDGAPNRNPALADDLLWLDGALWPAPDPSGAAAPREACVDRGLPSLRSEQRSVLRLELGGDDREPLASEPGTYAAHPRESLVYTHLASHVGLERAFSSIDYDAERLDFEVAFELDPSELEGAPTGPEGETVSFYLLVRDERGGVDWIRRDACLLSP
jgi:hypothetical protein